MKFANVGSIAFVTTLLTVLACGSQVVEFPLDETTDPTSDGGVTDDVSTVDPIDDNDVDDDKPCPCEDDEGDSGTQDDSGTGDGGNPTKDAGSDSGDPRGPEDGGKGTCDAPGKGRSCGQEYGCCVSSCAHRCNGLKDHKKCSKYNKCFKQCKAKCFIEKLACECKR